MTGRRTGESPTRRAALRAGLTGLGGAAVLSGCAGAGDAVGGGGDDSINVLMVLDDLDRILRLLQEQPANV